MREVRVRHKQYEKEGSDISSFCLDVYTFSVQEDVVISNRQAERIFKLPGVGKIGQQGDDLIQVYLWVQCSWTEELVQKIKDILAEEGRPVGRSKVLKPSAIEQMRLWS